MQDHVAEGMVLAAIAKVAQVQIKLLLLLNANLMLAGLIAVKSGS